MGPDTFGSMHVSASFQRFKEHRMDRYWYQFTVTYLDDLLIYSATFEQHLEYLRLVFQKLKSYGIRVKASKCHLFKREISYLGRIMPSAWYTADPKNIIAVLLKLKKKSPFITELWCILLLEQYFKRLKLNFNQTANLLYQILTDTHHKKTFKRTNWLEW